MPNTTFNTIEEKRHELGVSQKKMSELIGISKQTYTNWSMGYTAPSKKYLDEAVKLKLVKCPCCGNITV